MFQRRLHQIRNRYEILNFTGYLLPIPKSVGVQDDSLEEQVDQEIQSFARSKRIRRSKLSKESKMIPRCTRSPLSSTVHTQLLPKGRRNHHLLSSCLSFAPTYRFLQQSFLFSLELLLRARARCALPPGPEEGMTMNRVLPHDTLSTPS